MLTRRVPMPDTHTVVLFLAASLVLLLIPGPAVLFVVARSVEQGRAAGAVSALGLSAGTAIQVAAAAGGLSAVVLRSALAFSLIKYVGAAYLVYLGLRTIAAPIRDTSLAQKRSAGPLELLGAGFLVNLLNPKLALFFLAFLPTFVDPRGTSPVLQIVFLGTLFVALGTVTDVTYALVVGSVRHVLSPSADARRRRNALSGATYIGLGLYTAFSGSRSSR